ncbi:sialoadhesin-like [Carassius carassius]|uniref:sialoadhesin-like n=1 Tax=Carassius carassius TaxID=217509 RepID=UPI0028689FA5|nr:sialoadhesin-like [Carassius carassius]
MAIGNMTGDLLLRLIFQVVLLYDALGWEVRMPKEIHGLKGSCLVIPCSFSYTSYPPENPNRIVWYQYVSRGYPLVYDPLNPNDVIEKFKGYTDLYGNSSWDCSLLIKNLKPSHHGEKLYTWIDPENVGKSTYAFYDVTSTILVDASPQQPSINIYGGERTGETITVVCSTFHTCPYSKPTITLNGIEGSDHIDNELFKNGLWKITLTRTSVVKTEGSTIECSVTYHGGITVTVTKDKNAQSRVHKDADSASIGLKTIGFYILAPSLVFLLTCAITAFIVYRKRQRQPVNDMQGSLTPFEERRSRWNRFSRHFSRSEGRAGWSNRENRSKIRTNTCTMTENKPFSKPRMPSPKRYSTSAFEPHLLRRKI